MPHGLTNYNSESYFNKKTTFFTDVNIDKVQIIGTPLIRDRIDIGDKSNPFVNKNRLYVQGHEDDISTALFTNTAGDCAIYLLNDNRTDAKNGNLVDTGSYIELSGKWNTTNTAANRTWGRIGAFKETNTSDDGAGYLSLYSRPDGSGLTERLRITSTGNVGINSTEPARTLDVVGSIRKTVYEPGEIIETLVGVCDGNDVTVKSGTYTLSNVNADQILTDSHAVISGSSIEYTPPAGTTRVCYEFWVYMKDSGSGNNSRPLLHFQSQLDNDNGAPTVINNSRHTWRYASPIDTQDVQTWIYNKVIVSIGQVDTESVANGRLESWDSARTFRWTARRYSSSYAAQLHETGNWDGTGTDIRVRPHVKITAIA